MSYKPWPDDGCPLAEARERTADRELWNALYDRADRRPRQHKRPKSELQKSIDAAFLSLLQTQRLIAYGCKNHPRAAPQLIQANLWRNLKPGWQASAVSEGRPGGVAFHGVRVFPVLKAPCRVDLVAGKSLVEAFRHFVLDDPEVAALARAIRCAPEFQRVFVDGHCYVRGDSEWPLGGEALVGVVRDDSGWGMLIHHLAQPDPPIVADAADALTDRFNALFDLLRRGEILGRAVAANDGSDLVIIRSIWSHPDFWLNAQNGDVLQINPDCEDPPRDWLLRRWMGVVLEGPPSGQRSAREMAAPLETSAQPFPSKSTCHIQTSAAAQTECIAWLTVEMKKSVTARPGKKDDWWAIAEKNWPDRLTRRSFDIAWRLAIAASGAIAWSAAGAPRKPRNKSPHA